jgi:hypothetical protein
MHFLISLLWYWTINIFVYHIISRYLYEETLTTVLKWFISIFDQMKPGYPWTFELPHDGCINLAYFTLLEFQQPCYEVDALVVFNSIWNIHVLTDIIHNNLYGNIESKPVLPLTKDKHTAYGSII